MSKTGQYWAPRGPSMFLLPASPQRSILTNLIGDIGTADVTIGKDLPTPLQLPW